MDVNKRHIWNTDETDVYDSRFIVSRFKDYTGNSKQCTKTAFSYKKYVIKDVREQLAIKIVTYGKLTKKAKKLSVNFQTREHHQYYIDGLDFYIINGDIYFECDESIKREKLLSKLGIK